jgi:hypothetical protein
MLGGRLAPKEVKKGSRTPKRDPLIGVKRGAFIEAEQDLGLLESSNERATEQKGEGLG